MRKRNIQTILIAAAFCTSLCSTSFAGPHVYGTVVTKDVNDPTSPSVDTLGIDSNGKPAALDDTTWARLQDDTIDYDEIENLVEYRSILAQQQNASINNYAVNINEIVGYLESSIDDINAEISNLKDLRNETSDTAQKAYYTAMINALSSLVSSTGSDNLSTLSYNKATAQKNLKSIASSVKQALHGTKVTVTTGMNSAFIGYQTLSALEDIYEKQVEYYQTIYDKTVKQQAVGSATALEVKVAEANLKNAQNTLFANSEQLRNIKEQMALLLGWSIGDLDRVVIGDMPAYDASYMASRNLQSDIEEAKKHNVAYGTAAGTVDKDITGYTETDISRNEAKENLNITMSTLYNTAIEAGAKYEAAQAGYIVAKRQKDAAERSYAAGLMGSAEYAGSIAQYIASEAQANMSAIDASAAILNYQAALKGFV